MPCRGWFEASFVGDKINVVSPIGSITPLGMMPKMKPFG